MANSINVVIGATTGDATRALNELRTVINGLAGEMNRATPGIKGADVATSSFTDSMMRYKREQVGENRMVGFYVRELAAFTGAAGESKEVLAGLLGAVVGFASGNIIGAVFESARLAVVAVKELTGDTSAEIAKLDKQITDTVTRMKAALGDKAEAQYQEKLGPVLAKFNQDRDAINESIAKLREGSRVYGGQLVIDYSLIGHAQERLADVTKKYQEAVARFQAQRDKARSAYSAIDALGKTAPEAEGAKPGSTDPWAGQGKAKDDTPYDALLEARLSASRFILAQQEKDAKAAADYELGLQQALNQGLSLAYKDDVSERRKALDEQVKAIHKKDDEERKSLAQSSAQWKAYGQRVGSVLGEMASGAKGWQQSVKAILRQAAQDMLAWALGAVLRNAGVTASNVMEENSKLGPYGWIAGLVQAAAAFAATMAFGNGFSSAAGGWDVPWTVGSAGYPTMVHGGEKVTDANRSARMDRAFDAIENGQQSGGPQVHFHGPVYDRQGVYRLLMDHWGEVQDAHRAQGRMGRGV